MTLLKADNPAQQARHARVGAAVLVAALVVVGLTTFSLGRLALAVALPAGMAVAILWWVPRRGAEMLAVLWAYVCVQLTSASMLGHDFPDVARLVQYADDGLIALFLVRLAASGLRLQRWLVPAALFLCCGLAGAVLAGTPLPVVAEAAYLGCKLWIVLLIAVSVEWTSEGRRLALKIVMWTGLVIALLGVVDRFDGQFLVDYLNLRDDVLGGFRQDSVQSIFPGPGRYAFVMAFLAAVSMSYLAARLDRRRRLLAALAFVSFAASAASSLRIKPLIELAAACGVFVLWAALHNRRLAARVAVPVAAVVLGCAVVLAPVLVQQWENYTGARESPRALLYQGGVEVAKDHVPFGVGFGRYGSHPARTHYSDVYYDLGFDKIAGMSPADSDFLADTSWPAVMGESGFLGFLAYATALAMVLGGLVRLARRTVPGSPAAAPVLTAVMAATVVLLESLASPTLFESLMVLSFAIAVGPALQRVQRSRVLALQQARDRGA